MYAVRFTIGAREYERDGFASLAEALALAIHARANRWWLYVIAPTGHWEPL